MATMIEKKMNSIIKEIEHLNKSLDKRQFLLQKKIEKCIKLDCNWTKEERLARKDAGETISDKQEEAWFNKYCAEGDVEDLERRIANAESRLSKITGKVEEQKEFTKKQEEIKEMESSWLKMLKEELQKTPEERKAEYKAWVKEFTAMCAKDGIQLDNDPSSTWISGQTPSGKHFMVYINSGYSERSFYCYTLNIAGETIFTSGTFGTCYQVIKNR